MESFTRQELIYLARYCRIAAARAQEKEAAQSGETCKAPFRADAAGARELEQKCERMVKASKV